MSNLADAARCRMMLKTIGVSGTPSRKGIARPSVSALLRPGTSVKRLLDGVNRFRLHEGYAPQDWDRAAQEYFGPLLRRRSVLRHDKEIFRSELVNLAKILPYTANVQLLKTLLKSYRRVLRRQPAAAKSLLVRHFADTARADERWMTFFIGLEPRVPQRTAYERAARAFNTLDIVLEGCLKPHVRLVLGFLSLENQSTVLPSLEWMDFGKLIAEMPPSLGALDLVLRDPEHNLPANQWRNIAAHKDFRVISNRTLEISWGPTQRSTKRITLASTERVVTWAVVSLATLRMCTVLTYLEYMTELKAAGLTNQPLRLEGVLAGLCHNLGTVGFECRAFFVKGDLLTLRLRNSLARSVRDAVVHASQVLDQLAIAAQADPSRQQTVKRVAVELCDSQDQPLASATVAVAAAVDHLDRRLPLKKYIENMHFLFRVPPTAEGST